jgi:spore coat polysaccharide biosynthesis protein SpsF
MIVLAITENREDDIIAQLAKDEGVPVYRGPEDNVLERFSQAAKKYGIEHIMRLTADCPLIDPELLDELMTFYSEGYYDYVSNSQNPTLPDGLDAEIFSFKTLEETYKNAVLSSHTEHVTPYIREHPELFKTGCLTYRENLSNMRWTVDRPEDFELVRQIIEALYDPKRVFLMKDILNFLGREGELREIHPKPGKKCP